MNVHSDEQVPLGAPHAFNARQDGADGSFEATAGAYFSRQRLGTDLPLRSRVPNALERKYAHSLGWFRLQHGSWSCAHAALVVWRDVGSRQYTARVFQRGSVYRWVDQPQRATKHHAPYGYDTRRHVDRHRRRPFGKRQWATVRLGELHRAASNEHQQYRSDVRLQHPSDIDVRGP